MAKKPYDVTERFQEVARRARETGPINTGPKKKPAAPVDQPKTFVGGTGKKDVNLPIDTAPKTGFGQMTNKDLDVMNKAHKKLKR